MGKRRDGREAAIQFLFSRDLQGEQKPEDAEVFWTLHSAKASTRAYAESLIKGVIDHQEEIDGHITSLVENFRLERLAAVDRNVLRVASYELLYCPTCPRPSSSTRPSTSPKPSAPVNPAPSSTACSTSWPKALRKPEPKTDEPLMDTNAH
jgi:N utilization substance protein B